MTALTSATATDTGDEESRMRPMAEMPLILGGHSFISQLGNDPPASEAVQRKIVESCLEHGIRWFDTTYQPERVALGKALHALGRRDEATILAWNFFTGFSPGDSVGEAECYRPEHIEIILEELRTACVDCLVMVSLDDPEKNQRQEDLLIEWQRKGYVRSLGLWISDSLLIERYRGRNPFRFAIRPFNITADNALPVFAACKRSGWETLATSPFVRGWELDRRIADASLRGYGDAESLRLTLADLMLRFSFFHRDIDRVMVAMRKVEWVSRNVASVSKGPLTAEELSWLENLSGLASKNRSFWDRFRRWF
jgi:aryl-alcohol dehydrogenase-like predicted oxidoreductase